MRLNQLTDLRSKNKTRNRVGRGVGSGWGKTCGSGQKGQKSRTGVAINGYEGGQMPLHRRLPKFGFNPLTPKNIAVVNLIDLQRAIEAGKLTKKQEVTLEVLQKIGLARPQAASVKLLAKGELKEPLQLHVDMVSAAARQAVEKLGGSVSLTA